MPSTDELERVRRALSVELRDPALLDQALRHKSAGTLNNERLEFLGDAVLGQVIAHALYEKFPAEHEDGLSLMRAALVRRDSLAEIARELDLGRAIDLGPGELRSGGHQRSSILADALEAVLGAIYLDQGFAPTEALIRRLFAGRIEHVEVRKDAKTRLQEHLQARKVDLPQYSVTDVTGADHARHYQVKVELADGSQHAFGEASSRRAAEQEAANKLLQLLGES